MNVMAHAKGTQQTQENAPKVGNVQAKPQRALILADGEAPSAALAQRLARQAEVCIAVDGAAHKAVTLGITPDILCGDFDSVRLDEARAAFPNALVAPTPDQDFADLEKALLLARERGATHIVLLGATGGRMDHALGNFALLQRYADALSLCLVDDRAVTWAMSEGQHCAFPAVPGETVSLVTFTGATVSIAGVRWPLNAHRLLPGTHGVSNVADAAQVTVEVDSGSAFVIHLASEPAGF